MLSRQGTSKNYTSDNTFLMIEEFSQPGDNYKVTVEAVGTSVCGTQVYRAVLVKEEILALLAKACKFMSQPLQDKKTQTDFMYRNKPSDYYRNIIQNNGYIMHKYMKDFNGDPGSPINGAIQGLFFSVWLNEGKRPTKSPFGNWRIILPVKRMITPKQHNVYFSDFYCNFTKHYATLVVTEKGSLEDEFCKSHLIDLGFHRNSNPFFHFDHQTNKFFCSAKVIVEILYCKDVDIRCVFQRKEGCSYDIVKTFGSGRSTPRGIQKNSSCSICNIIPKQNIISCNVEKEEEALQKALVGFIQKSLRKEQEKEELTQMLTLRTLLWKINQKLQLGEKVEKELGEVVKLVTLLLKILRKMQLEEEDEKEKQKMIRCLTLVIQQLENHPEKEQKRKRRYHQILYFL